MPLLRCAEGSIVSVGQFLEKRRVARGLDRRWQPAVLEMETYVLGLSLLDQGVPLMGFRAVCDEWGLGVAASMKAWTDETLGLRGFRMTLDLLRNPWRIGLLIKMFSRSVRAARSLSIGIRTLLDCWAADEDL